MDIKRLTSNQWAMIKTGNLIEGVKLLRDLSGYDPATGIANLGLYEARQTVMGIKDGSLIYEPTKDVCPHCKGTGLIDV